jgi:hypothetical protein
MGRTGVFDHAAPEPREARLPGRPHRRFIRHQVVVVHVRHSPTPVRMQGLPQLTHHERLEMEHDVPTNQRMLEAGEEEQPGRLHGTGRQHDVGGLLDVVGAVGADPLHSGRQPVRHQNA